MLLTALATKYNQEIYKMDGKPSFQNGELKEEMYFIQLDSFIKKGHKHQVCRLKKTLYGLKHAPRSLYAKI